MAVKMRRIFGIMTLAVWATLWPHNYGYDAHNTWVRLGAIVLLTFRALFIGYAGALLVMRPMLAYRNPGQEPFPSVREALSKVRQQLRAEREQRQ